MMKIFIIISCLLYIGILIKKKRLEKIPSKKSGIQYISGFNNSNVAVSSKKTEIGNTYKEKSDCILLNTETAHSPSLWMVLTSLYLLSIREVYRENPKRHISYAIHKFLLLASYIFPYIFAALILFYLIASDISLMGVAIAFTYILPAIYILNFPIRKKIRLKLTELIETIDAPEDHKSVLLKNKNWITWMIPLALLSSFGASIKLYLDLLKKE